MAEVEVNAKASNLAREFLSVLDKEEAYIEEKVSDDKSGLFFITALKIFDLEYVRRKKSKKSVGLIAPFYLLRIGLPRFIETVFRSIPYFDHDEVTFSPDAPMVEAATKFLMFFGMIEVGRQFAHLTLSGDCDLQIDESGRYRFAVPCGFSHADFFEQSVEEHYRRIHRAIHGQTLKSNAAYRQALRKAPKRFKRNVRVFADRYIAYEADPLLDDLHFALAYAKLDAAGAFSEFPADVRFGGIPFATYVFALTFVVSAATKHAGFAEALVKVAPQIRQEDILTLTADRSEYDEALLSAVNEYGVAEPSFSPVSLAQIQQILTVLSVDRESLGKLRTTEAALPPLISFSRKAWIRSISLAQLDPIEALLVGLRHHFPTDWDRAQQLREPLMQDELEQMLGRLNPPLEMRRNIILRDGNRHLTDLDFVAFDPDSGLMLLYQLKHQDHFKGDMRARYNRTLRLRKQSTKWIQTVRAWVDQTSDNVKCDVLRIKQPNVPLKVELVVLGRKFAHHLSSENMFGAAYGTWAQSIDAFVLARRYGGGSLVSYFKQLQSHRPDKLVFEKPNGIENVYHLSDAVFTVREALS